MNSRSRNPTRNALERIKGIQLSYLLIYTLIFLVKYADICKG